MDETIFSSDDNFKKVITGDNRETEFTREEIMAVTSYYKNLVSQLPRFEIEGNTIHIFSAEEIEEISICRIENALYEGPGSVNDPRMGVLDKRKLCETCGLGNYDCPGHAGYIVLNSPIYHPLFLSEIIHILSSVCRYCSRLLLSEEYIRTSNLMKLPPAERLKKIEKESERVSCQNHSHSNISEEQLNILKKSRTPEDYQKLVEDMKMQNSCRNQPKPIYFHSKIKDTHKVQYKEGDKGIEQIMPIEVVKSILDAIPEEDCKVLGFNHGSKPGNLILTILPVTPPNTRPPNYQNGIQKPNKTTEQYVKIEKINLSLIASDKKKERWMLEEDLFNAIDNLFERTDKTSPSAGDYFKSFKDFIQGKKGIIRKLLMGKRGNYNGRTVIDPDPTLKFGQVRVPKVFESSLTRREYINKRNLNEVDSLLKDDKITHLIHEYGVHLNSIREIRPDNYHKSKNYLRIGDSYRRLMENTDMVIMNRQPTLHRYGMMAMNTVLGNEYSIGFHPSITTPYGADADGDESNLYGCPSFESQAEAQCVMNIKLNILSSGSGNNTMGLVYDNITGAYMLTGDNVIVPGRLWRRCLRKITQREQLTSLETRLERYKIKMYSGKALFSACLPSNFFYSSGEVIIKEGILIKGRIKSNHVGPKSNRSIIQMLAIQYPITYGETKDDYIQSRAADFITDASFVITEWLTENSLSIGPDDCTFTDRNKARQIIDSAIDEARSRIAQLNVESKFINAEYIENLIIQALNETKASMVKLTREALKPDNAMIIMTSEGAGTKGSLFNISQSFAFIGDQMYRGERIKPTISNYRRTLPYYPLRFNTIESRGFCINSFWDGLSVTEFFFHFYASREGSIDNVANVPTTGSIYTRLIKALDNFRVEYDYSARNKVGNPFNFIYGRDGFDAAQLVKIKVDNLETNTFVDIKSEVEKINSELGWIK